MTPHVDEQLSAYLDDELDGLTRQRISAHLEQCDRCSARLAELAALDHLSRDTSVEAPDGYFEALPGRIRGRLGERVAQQWVAPRWTWAAAAAALIAVLAPLTIERSSDIVPEAAQPSRSEAPRRAAPPLSLAKQDDSHELLRQIQVLDETVAGTAGDGKKESEARAYRSTPRKDALEAKSVADAPAAPAPEPAANRPAPKAKAREGALASRKRAAEPAPAATAAPAPAGLASAVAEAPAESNAIAESDVAAQQEEGIADRDQDALARTSGEAISQGRRENADLRAAVGGLTTAEALRMPADAERVEQLRVARERLRLEVRDADSDAARDDRLLRIATIGVEIFEASDDEQDRLDAERDAEAYLAQDGGRHQEAVHDLLRRLKR